MCVSLALNSQPFLPLKRDEAAILIALPKYQAKLMILCSPEKKIIPSPWPIGAGSLRLSCQLDPAYQFPMFNPRPLTSYYYGIYVGEIRLEVSLGILPTANRAKLLIPVDENYDPSWVPR